MLAVTNATGYIGDGTRLTGETILVATDGNIEAVARNVDVPATYRVIDATGFTITPGLIDVHTHLGVHEEGIGQPGADFNETSDAATPHIRALDGINPMEKGFADARQFGVTTVQIMPGSANVIGGTMSVLKTVGTVVDDMLIREDSGLKAATGENPKRVHGAKGKMPVTRMGVAGLLRERLIEGQDYIQKQKEGIVPRDLGKEAIAKVLQRYMPLRVHAHRAEDIMTVLRIQREFAIDVTIEHCTEGHKIIQHLQNSGVKVSVGPTMSTRSKVELTDKGWDTVVQLEQAGIPFSITTDHPVVGIEHLMTSAILAVKAGVTPDGAMKGITMNAAEHLGMEKRVGSLEVGKEADFVLWSGDPFDLRTKVHATYIEGKQVYGN